MYGGGCDHARGVGPRLWNRLRSLEHERIAAARCGRLPEPLFGLAHNWGTRSAIEARWTLAEAKRRRYPRVMRRWSNAPREVSAEVWVSQTHAAQRLGVSMVSVGWLIACDTSRRRREPTVPGSPARHSIGKWRGAETQRGGTGLRAGGRTSFGGSDSSRGSRQIRTISPTHRHHDCVEGRAWPLTDVGEALRTTLGGLLLACRSARSRHHGP